VLFEVYDKYNISGKTVRQLVSFSSEVDYVLMGDTLLDGNFQYFLLLADLLSFAGLALMLLFDGLALSFAGRTVLLNLLIHSWSHLDQFSDYSSSFAVCAGFDLTSSFSVAYFTTSLSFVGNLQQLSIIRIL
jgi:hypothetical protein